MRNSDGREALNPGLRPFLEIACASDFVEKYSPSIAFVNGNVLLDPRMRSLFTVYLRYFPLQRRTLRPSVPLPLAFELQFPPQISSFVTRLSSPLIPPENGVYPDLWILIELLGGRSLRLQPRNWLRETTPSRRSRFDLVH